MQREMLRRKPLDLQNTQSKAGSNKISLDSWAFFTLFWGKKNLDNSVLFLYICIYNRNDAIIKCYNTIENVYILHSTTIGCFTIWLSVQITNNRII
jgi:hypothetical protein